MPLRVTRRPYQLCPFTWSLTVAGVNAGEGSVSDAQCLDLNGTFDLDFKSCISQHDRLVWSGECEPGDSGGGCAMYELVVSGVSGFDCADTYNGTFIMRPAVVRYLNQEYQCLWTSARRSSADQFVDENCDCSVIGVPAQPPFVWLSPPDSFDIRSSVWSFFGGTYDEELYHGRASLDGTTFYPFHVNYNRSPGGYISSCAGPPCATVTPPPTLTWTRSTTPTCGTWPDEIVATLITSGVSGPGNNDRIRSKWHLEYLIAETKWVLRSFNRIDYPIYSLIDADPCTGNEKILTLETPPDGAEDGCTNAPPTVTITRACSPERAARDHKRSKRNGQLKRPCGCACDDEVDDLRHECASQCASTSTAGCETWDADQITCKFPAGSDCCTYCEEDKAPCAYEALTTCDLSYNGIPIMAKTVTLRHDCYFEDSCDWVAVGPSPNAADGGLGAQPVCATCSDTCLTGCSWDAWQTAECP